MSENHGVYTDEMREYDRRRAGRTIVTDEFTEEEKFYIKRRQLLEKFGPEWIQKMKYSTLAYKAYNALMQKDDPYALIEALIGIIEEQNKILVNLLR